MVSQDVVYVMIIILLILFVANTASVALLLCDLAAITFQDVEASMSINALLRNLCDGTEANLYVP